jgi:transglutaminase-like putative cysteine protease
MAWGACVFFAAIAVVVGAATDAAIGGDAAPWRRIDRETTFRVRMTTSVRIPAEGAPTDGLRVRHALPTSRPWSAGADDAAAARLETTPADGRRVVDAASGDAAVEWSVGRLASDPADKKKSGSRKKAKDAEPLTAGAGFEFASSFTVRSARREFLPAAEPSTWRDLDAARGRDAPAGDAAPKASPPAEVAEQAVKLRAERTPAAAVLAACSWLKSRLRYDASCPVSTDDVGGILREGRGHCGHHYGVFRALCREVGIPVRSCWGLNLYSRDGTGKLADLRADWVNVHTWAEVWLPKAGWVEVEPSEGASAFRIPETWIQANREFQVYAVRVNQGGADRAPTWTWKDDRFVSSHGVSNVVRFEVDGGGASPSTK